MLLLTISILTLCPLSFAGEGHDAGSDWAEEKGIDDPNNCYSSQPGRWEGDYINNSRSFTEGCLDYLRDEGITDKNDDLKDSDKADDIEE